jgi:hypothetical protein
VSTVVVSTVRRGRLAVGTSVVVLVLALAGCSGGDPAAGTPSASVVAGLSSGSGGPTTPAAASATGSATASSTLSLPPSATPSASATTSGSGSAGDSGSGSANSSAATADCRPLTRLNGQQSAAAAANPVFKALFTGRTATLRRVLGTATRGQVNDATAVPPIVEAVANRCLNATRLLLDAGADPNLYWTDGEVRSPIALQLAAQADDVTTLRLLLSRGARVTEFGGDGQTATVAAASANAVRALTVLLAAGASPSARVPDPDYSFSPLEAAVRAPAPAAVDLLLARKATRSTSLLYPAIESGSLPMVKKVLAAGISPAPPVTPSAPYAFITATSPAAYATSRGRTAIAAALRAAGG